MMRTGRYVVVGVAMLLLAGCGFQQVAPPKPTPVPSPTPIPTVAVTGGSVAATVNGTPIAMSLFRALTNYSFRASIQNQSPITPREAAKDSLGQLIEYVVALQQAKSLGVSPTAAAVTARINSTIAGSHTTKAAFYKNLETQGLTVATFTFLLKAVVAQTNVANKLFPKPSKGPVAQARQILVSAKQSISPAEALFTRTVTATTDKCTGRILTFKGARVEAQKLLARLHSGASFSTLAKKCSDDPSSGATGGWLAGPLNTHVLYPYAEEFAPNIETAIFSGPLHNTFQLIPSIDGWHIIQVTNRKTVAYPKAVNTSLGVTIPADIQEYHLQSRLNLASQRAYAHTTVYEKVS